MPYYFKMPKSWKSLGTGLNKIQYDLSIRFKAKWNFSNKEWYVSPLRYEECSKFANEWLETHDRISGDRK